MLGMAQAHLVTLTTNTREALLLAMLEEFSISDIAIIMNTDCDEVRHLIDVARKDMEQSSLAKSW